MSFTGLKTARTRLLEIETEQAKVEEWGSGTSKIKYRTLADLDSEYKYILNLITKDTDLDLPIAQLKFNANYADRKVYAIQQ